MDTPGNALRSRTRSTILIPSAVALGLLLLGLSVRLELSTVMLENFAGPLTEATDIQFSAGCPTTTVGTVCPSDYPITDAEAIEDYDRSRDPPGVTEPNVSGEGLGADDIPALSRASCPTGQVISDFNSGENPACLASAPIGDDCAASPNFVSGADLKNCELSHANLFNANLRYANLFNTNLYNANLGRANLFNANLGRTNLSGANLRDANLIDADLSRADLSNANLSNALLADADLSGTHLSNCDVNGASLSNANLSGANLSNCDASGAILRRANLTFADLADVKLTLADVTSANLSNAILSNADLTFTNLIDADLSNADLSNAILSNADLRNANLVGTNLFSVSWFFTICPDGTNSDDGDGDDFTCLSNL